MRGAPAPVEPQDMQGVCALAALRVAGQGRVSLGASLALQSGLFSGF